MLLLLLFFSKKLIFFIEWMEKMVQQVFSFATGVASFGTNNANSKNLLAIFWYALWKLVMFNRFRDCTFDFGIGIRVNLPSKLTIQTMNDSIVYR
jgi:hypothetical protein